LGGENETVDGESKGKEEKTGTIWRKTSGQVRTGRLLRGKSRVLTGTKKIRNRKGEQKGGGGGGVGGGGGDSGTVRHCYDGGGEDYRGRLHLYLKKQKNY